MESETKEGENGWIYGTPHREIECDAVAPLLTLMQPLSLCDVEMSVENGTKWSEMELHVNGTTLFSADRMYVCDSQTTGSARNYKACQPRNRPSGHGQLYFPSLQFSCWQCAA